MKYEVAESVQSVQGDTWTVEAFGEIEGECYIAQFYGVGAKQRAEEYAAWRNAEEAAK